MRREKIINILKSKLENTGGKVLDWYVKKLEDTEYPAIIIRDIEDTIDDNDGINAHTLSIEIDIAINKATSQDLREKTSQVYEAIKAFESETNYICKNKKNTFAMEFSDAIYGGVRVEIDIEYSTPRWQQ